MNPRRRQTAFERIKQHGAGLRGTIAQELAADSLGFSSDNVWLLKHHGVFQQDDRSQRKRSRRLRRKDSDRPCEFMVRIRTTGGKLTIDQMQGVLEIADELGDGQLRLTSRQGMQIRGIRKSELKTALRRITKLELTTLAASGDLNCNVMCCPAPPLDRVHAQLQAAADAISSKLMPSIPAYNEIWINGHETPHRPKSECLSRPGAAPLYGKTLLPRKFKVAIATPQDNCTSVYSQDVGLLAAVEGENVVGYDVLVGGSMGTILGVADRFPAIAQPMAFVDLEGLLPLVLAIARVYHQCGDRSDRSKARLKYLIHQWGLPSFQRAVEECLGRPLQPPRGLEVVGYQDHLGWMPWENGGWYLGLHVENGIVYDTDTVRLKTALRKLTDYFDGSVRLTPQQNFLLCDIKPSERHDIEALLADHGILPAKSLGNVRRNAVACTGWPNCPSAITESNQALPDIVDAIETEVSRLGLSEERFTLRVTGCPFGCTRSYLADVALVGRTIHPVTGQAQYAIFVGGDTLGRRLNTLYKDLVPADQIMATLRPLLSDYKEHRTTGETLGDFCQRRGIPEDGGACLTAPGAMKMQPLDEMTRRRRDACLRGRPQKQ